jgi:hypothetical protein
VISSPVIEITLFLFVAGLCIFPVDFRRYKTMSVFSARSIGPEKRRTCMTTEQPVVRVLNAVQPDGRKEFFLSGLR